MNKIFIYLYILLSHFYIKIYYNTDRVLYLWFFSFFYIYYVIFWSLVYIFEYLICSKYYIYFLSALYYPIQYDKGLIEHFGVYAILKYIIIKNITNSYIWISKKINKVISIYQSYSLKNLLKDFLINWINHIWFKIWSRLSKYILSRIEIKYIYSYYIAYIHERYWRINIRLRLLNRSRHYYVKSLVVFIFRRYFWRNLNIFYYNAYFCLKILYFLMKMYKTRIKALKSTICDLIGIWFVKRGYNWRSENTIFAWKKKNILKRICTLLQVSVILLKLYIFIILII